MANRMGYTVIGATLVLAQACTDSDDTKAPSTYSFVHDETGQSSVSYDGQVMRHMLIADLTAHIGGLTARIDSEEFFPESGDLLEELNFYYEFDSSSSGDVAIALSTEPQLLQEVYNDVSTDKDLKGKIAGNDPEGQHKDFSAGFVGWQVEGVTSPDSLIQHWFNQLEEMAVDRAQGDIGQDPQDEPLQAVFVNEQGVDLQQLIQKFLGVAVAFSQGTDDYLDDDVAGSGLNADNAELEDGRSYTALEHAWDEAFGYFGAARDYGDYTDAELAASDGRESHRQGYFDSNGDARIDLLSEYNAGHSTNAAKRDLGSKSGTDLTQDVFDAFLQGRQIIAESNGPLSATDRENLVAARDSAVLTWEKAIAATVVHYINEVLIDMAAFGTDEYDFYAHAKHWSELKGFALGFQFNPRSPVDDESFAQLHQLIGQAPVLPNQEGVAEYQEALREARSLVMQAYDFNPAEEGDADGQGGW